MKSLTRIFGMLMLIVVSVVSMGIGFEVAKYYHEEDIKDFQIEAVQFECGFWNVNGDFDWKNPELSIEVIGIKEVLARTKE